MEEKKIIIELSAGQYRDLVKLMSIGNLVTDEISDDDTLSGLTEVQQKVLAACDSGKGNLYIAYDKKEDEYFLAEEFETELIDLMDEYDESRFWENLVMRLTMRDLQKKFSEKELREMPDEKGNKELENIHSYYINEFDDNDLENLKVVAMKKI